MIEMKKKKEKKGKTGTGRFEIIKELKLIYLLQRVMTEQPLV